MQVPHKLSDKDHPRLRGEYTFVNSFNPQLTGSPPLARGVRTTINLCSIERRITPACAGSTCRTHEGLEAVEDHPRLRGEYYYHSHTESLLEGSPPLARGVLFIRIRSMQHLRITPACAGSTDFKTLGAKKYWDHPRLRGEYCKRMHRLLRRRGSPPLARGVLQKNAQTFAKKRITPACAGSTLLICRNVKRCKDHPRLRGEYEYYTVIAWEIWGSPPLARGVLIIWTISPPLTRITPACAGSTVAYCETFGRY